MDFHVHLLLTDNIYKNISFIFFQNGNASRNGEPTSTVFCDTWTSGGMISGKQTDASYLEKFMARSKVITDQEHIPSYTRSASNGSYFEVYKNKMKKLKAAGLLADANMINSINSINPNMAVHNTSRKQYDVAYKKGSLLSAGPSASPRDGYISPPAEHVSSVSPIDLPPSSLGNVSPIPLRRKKII